ncbi:MAG: hypothetical protein JWO85_2665 [Candidatus Eremiobacteraeota bacterium]|nr:hypothetical protein [Candidatus Eremiobacteraeota bacterium]
MPVVALPYSFSPGTPALSAQVDANLNTLVNAINGGIDFANVGAAGFYASQIIPTTMAQAIFGGAQAYSFPAGIAVGGPLTTATTGGFSGKVIIGAASATSQVGPVSLDLQGADTFTASGGNHGIVSIMSTSAAGIDKGATITLGGNTGNALTSYVFGAIRAAKNSAAGDGNYAGYLDLYSMADNGAVVKALHLDKLGGGTFFASSTATSHISTGTAASGGAGTVSIGGTVALTVGAAGGGAALPATPSGYVIINVAGSQMKLPYYNP